MGKFSVTGVDRCRKGSYITCGHMWPFIEFVAVLFLDHQHPVECNGKNTLVWSRMIFNLLSKLSVMAQNCPSDSWGWSPGFWINRFRGQPSPLAYFSSGSLDFCTPTSCTLFVTLSSSPFCDEILIKWHPQKQSCDRRKTVVMEACQRNGFVAPLQSCPSASHLEQLGKVLLLLNNTKIIQFKDHWSIRRKVCWRLTERRLGWNCPVRNWSSKAALSWCMNDIRHLNHTGELWIY